MTAVISDKQILVVGAGIGGLAFAACMTKFCNERKINIPVIRILERDPAPFDLGYSLSVRGAHAGHKGGIEVIQALGLVEQLAATSPPGHRMLALDNNGGEVFCMDGFRCPTRPGDRDRDHLRVPRFGLRKILLDALDTNKVKITWGVCVTGVEEYIDNGVLRVRVTLSNGTVEEADYLIAADGVNSKVRTLLLPDEKLKFTGACMILVNSHFDQLPEVLFHGPTFVLTGTGRGLFMAPTTANEASFGLSWSQAEPRKPIRGNTASNEEIQQLLLECKEKSLGLPHPLPAMIEHAIPESVMVLNAMEKPAHRNVPPVIYIGDACHPMSPFSGNGANQAMLDGLYLANMLTDSKHKDIHAALKAYDAESGPRSLAAIKDARTNIAAFHATGYKAKAYVVFFKVMGFVFNHPKTMKVVMYATTAAVVTATGFGAFKLYGRMKSQQ